MRKDSNLLLAKQLRKMETQIQIFTSEVFGKIRTCQVNNQIMFVGKDVATALGYSNVRDALSKHVDSEDKGVAKCDTLGGAQKITLINESGLYSQIDSLFQVATGEGVQALGEPGVCCHRSERRAVTFQLRMPMADSSPTKRLLTVPTPL